MDKKIQVVVIGDSQEIETNNKIAYETGRIIAENDCVLITGGREGVMRAANKGAIDSGGIVVSILPDGKPFRDNPYFSIVIPTGIGFARNSINVLSGDIVVAIGGGSGTLSEIAYAWGYGKPIIAFENAIGWSAKLAGQKLDNRRNDYIIGVKGISEFQEIFKSIISKI